MSSAKRLKLSHTSNNDTTSQHEQDDVDMKSQNDPDLQEEASSSGGSDEDSLSAGNSEPDTEEEITNAKLKKSSKTLKRKRRATEPSQFGATLQSLLDTQAPSALPLSLRPNVARKKNDEKLEKRAHKLLQIEKKDKEDKGRIKDVIGGWGGESERTLRKVAQRGVVKLFNVIQQTQNNAAVAAEEVKASRGSGKPTLPAPSIDPKDKRGKNKGKQKDNLLGRGKEVSVNKDDFLDIIRSGGVVSKA